MVGLSECRDLSSLYHQSCVQQKSWPKYQALLYLCTKVGFKTSLWPSVNTDCGVCGHGTPDWHSGWVVRGLTHWARDPQWNDHTCWQKCVSVKLNLLNPHTGFHWASYILVFNWHITLQVQLPGKTFQLVCFHQLMLFLCRPSWLSCCSYSKECSV